MDKRYQVFVSSTYADLKEERRRVIQTLMEMDCIPCGMEIFPAADEEQWAFIKKIIDDCDYYLLIISGRYGSVTAEGISYTEKEYDYAVSVGLKVLAFLHGDPGEISANRTELDPELREKLQTFRERVSQGRLVKSWTKAEELPGLVSLSLSKTIKTYPAVGWVRADRAANTDVLNEVNELRKRNQELEKLATDTTRHNTTSAVNNLAGLDEKITMFGTHWHRDTKYKWEHKLTWQELFALIAPYLLQNPNEEYVKGVLTESLFEKSGRSGTSVLLNDQIFQTTKVQFMALNLVNVRYAQTIKGGMALFWSLTPLGHEQLIQLRAVKSEKAT